MNKKVKILFTISVVVNILLLGAAGGMAYKKYSHKPYQEAYKDMSPQGQEIVSNTMREAFREGRSNMEEARNTKKEIRAILSAENFDAEAFEREAQKLHGIMRNFGQKRIEVTKSLAGQLNHADRMILAEKFSKGFHGHDRKGRKDKSAYRSGEGHAAPLAGSGHKTPQTPDLPEDMPPPPMPE